MLERPRPFRFRRCARWALAVAALLTAATLRAADGDPWGTGYAAFDAGGTDTDLAVGVAAQSDGAVVVVGTVTTGAGTWQLALARFSANGVLDSTFGSGGRVVNPFAFVSNSTGVAIERLADGRFIVAGALDYGTGDQDFYVGRLLADGSPDTSFGGFLTGARAIPFDLGGDLTDALSALAIDRSGRIVVVGSVDVSSTDIDIGVARLTPDGEPSTSFSTDGLATVAISEDDLPDLGLAVAIGYESRIVVGGATRQASYGGHYDIVVVTLLSGGSLDSAFGGTGSIVFGSAGGGTNNEFCWALGIWPDGEIVVAGDFATGTDTWMWTVFRLTASGTYLNGTLGTFCDEPSCTHLPQDSIRALRLQGDGKVVVAGFGLAAPASVDFGIARLAHDLSDDLSFAGDGQTLYDFDYSVGADADYGNALAFDHDGRLLVAGSIEFNGLDTDFGWARFDSSYIFADGFDWPGGTSRWSSVP